MSQGSLTIESLRRVRFAPILTATVLTILLLWLFGRAAHVLLLLFLGILLALYLGALSDFLKRHLRLPQQVAYVSALLLTIGALTLLFAILVPPVMEQTQQLFRVLPNYIASWEAGIDRAIGRIPALRDTWQPGQHRIYGAILDQLGQSAQNVVPRIFGVVHGAINVFSIMVMGIYLSLQPGLYREWLIALFPPIHRDLVRDVLGDLAGTLRSWIVGQLFAMFVLGVLTMIGLYALRVPYPITFGVFTGLVAIVPFFGSLLSTTLPALFVLNGTGIWGFGPVAHSVFVILLGTVIHIAEANVVAPLVMAKKVDLPPVLTVMAVLITGTLLGPAGLLIAVPTLAVIMVVVRRILITRIYEGQGFRRTTRDRMIVLRLPAPEGGVVATDGGPIDVVSRVERARATTK
ncbi:MAG TPA: AI-2E family transporter [Thermoanaerobaculia bacterium]